MQSINGDNFGKKMLYSGNLTWAVGEGRLGSICKDARPKNKRGHYRSGCEVAKRYVGNSTNKFLEEF